jgi:hypothetical protein
MRILRIRIRFRIRIPNTGFSLFKTRMSTYWISTCVDIKGTVSRDFLLQVFFMNHFPQAPENNVRVISNFFENSRRYSQAKVPHRCQRHQWQIMRTISGCRHLKVNLRQKYIYMLSLLPKGAQTKLLKFFS